MPDAPTYDTVVDTLAASVGRLAALVGPLDEVALTTPAYPTEWTVAQVLSHLGSGAVIFRQRLEDARTGADPDDAFAPAVWAEWDAKAPTAQAADFLAADAALLDTLRTIPADEQAALQVSLGPMSLPLATFAGMRLNEHALHSWDVAVTFDPAATVAPGSVDLVIDNLAMLAGFTAKPVGDQRLVVATTAPERRFTLVSTAEAVEVTAEADPTVAPDLTLPAEAFIRVVYGRLDPDHSTVDESPALATLRTMFPGA